MLFLNDEGHGDFPVLPATFPFSSYAEDWVHKQLRLTGDPGALQNNRRAQASGGQNHQIGWIKSSMPSLTGDDPHNLAGLSDYPAYSTIRNDLSAVFNSLA